MQSTYLLEKVLKMISWYVSALLCVLQRIVIHAMQLSGVNSPKENVMEIWEPKPPGTLWATPGKLRDSFTFFNCRLQDWAIITLGKS